MGELPRKLAFEDPTMPHQVNVAVDRGAFRDQRETAPVHNFKDTVSPPQPDIAAPTMGKLVVEEARLVHESRMIDFFRMIILMATASNPNS